MNDPIHESIDQLLLEQGAYTPLDFLLAEDRLLYWAQLKELAGLQVPASVRESIAAELEEEFDARVAEIHGQELAQVDDQTEQGQQRRDDQQQG